MLPSWVMTAFSATADFSSDITWGSRRRSTSPPRNPREVAGPRSAVRRQSRSSGSHVSAGGIAGHHRAPAPPGTSGRAPKLHLRAMAEESETPGIGGGAEGRGRGGEGDLLAE